MAGPSLTLHVDVLRSEQKKSSIAPDSKTRDASEEQMEAMSRPIAYSSLPWLVRSRFISLSLSDNSCDTKNISLKYGTVPYTSGRLGILFTTWVQLT